MSKFNYKGKEFDIVKSKYFINNNLVVYTLNKEGEHVEDLTGNPVRKRLDYDTAYISDELSNVDGIVEALIEQGFIVGDVEEHEIDGKTLKFAKFNYDKIETAR